MLLNHCIVIVVNIVFFSWLLNQVMTSFYINLSNVFYMNKRIHIIKAFIHHSVTMMVGLNKKEHFYIKKKKEKKKTKNHLLYHNDLFTLYYYSLSNLLKLYQRCMNYWTRYQAMDCVYLINLQGQYQSSHLRWCL